MTYVVNVPLSEEDVIDIRKAIHECDPQYYAESLVTRWHSLDKRLLSIQLKEFN